MTRNLFRLTLATLLSTMLWSCEQIDDNGVPEGLSVMIGETPVNHGDVVSVPDYSVTLDINYRKDLIVHFEPIGAEATYAEQLAEGSRSEFSQVTLESQSHLTFVTLSRAKNGEEVFQFTVSGPFTAEEAEAAVEEIGDEITTDVISLVQSEGVQGMQQLADLMYSTGNATPNPTQLLQNSKRWHERSLPTRESVRQHAAAMHKLFDVHESLGLTAKGEHVPSETAGRYEWNFTTQDFDLTDSTLTILEVLFPTQGSTTNNAVFQLTELEDSHDEATSTWEGHIAANMSVDGTEVMNTTYSHVQSPTEFGVVAEVYLNPFDYTLDAGYSEKDLLAHFTQLWSLDEEVLMATNLEATLEMVDGYPWPTEISGTQQVRNLTVEGTIDVNEANAWDGTANPDTFITATVWYDDTQMGDIIWSLETDEAGYEYWYPYLLLPNDEQVDVILLIEEKMIEIENALVTAMEDLMT